MIPRTCRAALVCAVLAGSAALSQAGLLVSESFSYGDGGLNGQSGGTGFGGNTGFNSNSSISGGVAVGGGLQLEAKPRCQLLA